MKYIPIILIVVGMFFLWAATIDPGSYFGIRSFDSLILFPVVGTVLCAIGGFWLFLREVLGE